MTGRKVSLSAQSLSTGLGQYTESNKLHYWLVCCSVPNVINKASRKLQCSVLKYFPPVCVVSLLCVLSALSKVEVEALPGTDLSISSALLSSSSPLPPPPSASRDWRESWLRLSCSLQNIDQRPLKFFSQAAPDWGILSQSRHHREIQGPIID